MTKRSIRRQVLAGISAVGAPMLLSSIANAQTWPTKPIRIIVGYPPGGLTDIFARAYGEHLSQRLGQQVVVENRSGAGGSLAAQAVKNSPPDGYTLMFTISTTMIMNKVLYKSLPYDPDKDFVLISSMSAGHLPLIVNKKLGITNLKEFVEYARTNKVTLGTYAAGSYSHIAVAELNRIFGLKMEAVHYRGEAPMWQDVGAGVIAGGSGSVAAATSVLQSGIAVPIAVPQTKRMRILPNVATFQEQGVPDKAFQLKGFICLVGPTGMPPELVQRLSDLMVEGGKTEKVQKILATFGIDEAAVSHQEFRKLVDEEAPIWLALVRSLGLTPL
ncbi:MAG: tripartite tricarboxylate transporter substrate binding protein [Burkholderiaceae bacterium]|nr:tripartite tricarboxylate transporter substrate binding protein [Burkholderiaceae bacterium]